METKISKWEEWEQSGTLQEKFDFIRKCSRYLVTIKEMCKYLEISIMTFSRLKRDHPEILKAMNDANLELKNDLINAMVKRALGYEVIEEEQFIEDSGKGGKQKRKIHRTKKQIPPDYKCIVYLMTKKYGKQFSERYEEIKLAKTKLKEAKKVWINEHKANGDNLQEDNETETL